jgi:hypothetical protein
VYCLAADRFSPWRLVAEDIIILTDRAVTAVAVTAIDRCDFGARTSFALIGFSFSHDMP